MTLIIDGNHSKAKVAMSVSDSLVVQPTNFFEDGLDGETEYLKNRDDKVKRLTNKVFFRSGGVRELCEWFYERLSDKVQPDDPLEICKQKARKVYYEMVEEEKQIDKGLDYDDDSYWLNFLYDEKGLPVCLNGFYEDGKTGMVNFSHGAWIEKEHPQRWVTSMVAPAVENEEKINYYLSRLNRVEKPGAHLMFYEYLMAFRDLLKECVGKVSKDMFVRINVNKDGEMAYLEHHIENVYDDEECMPFYSALKQLEELDLEGVS
ncbi:hypothetical protein [Alkalibacillus silvisoli]|uniref:Uncharacterized protein n=1 Tax=Alkalibacillus silvisoli TaxID=392823 RepID=A0ABN1AC30_9BACI